MFIVFGGVAALKSFCQSAKEERKKIENKELQNFNG